MNDSMISLSVLNNRPVCVGRNRYEVGVWLHLKIDTGSGYGEGTSHTEMVAFEEASGVLAQRFVKILCKRVQYKVKAMDLQDALTKFPVITQDAAQLLVTERGNQVLWGEVEKA